MTSPGPTVLQRTTVRAIATAAAHRAKFVAGLCAALAVVCLVVGAVDLVRGDSPDRNDTAAAFWVVIFGAVAVHAAGRARRAAGAARRAAGDQGTTWTLVGKLVVAADDRGQPVFDASFKITGAQRTMLLSTATAARASSS